MGTEYLKKEYRHRWSWDNPTAAYCYVVSEMVYWYKAPKGTTPYKLIIPNDPALHRFLIYPTNDIIDLTAEQFDNYEDVCYVKAKKSMFLQTGCTGPSKRAKVLAEYMGYNVNAWNDHR